MRRSILALAIITAAGAIATTASAQTSTSPTGPAFSTRFFATLLENAPPGFACWTIPVEPFLAQLSGSKEFVTVHERLAERSR